jgi:DNA repair protein RadD
MDNDGLIGDVVKQWKRLGEDRPTFCFCVNRAHGKHVNACFVGAGVASEYMDANTPAFEREEIFKRYRAGVTKIICSIGVLVAGVDEDVRCVVMARPTKSPILWVQMIGRGLRRAEGKDRLVIIDHTMNSWSLDTVSKIFFDKLHDVRKGPDLWSDEEREAAAEARVVQQRVCRQCSALLARHQTKCPECGNEFRPVCEVKTIDADLVELGSGETGRIGATLEEKRQFYRECLYESRRRGNSDGWAFYKYQGRFGKHDKPPWHWRDGSLPPASIATLNEIKHQEIAWRMSGGSRR